MYQSLTIVGNLGSDPELRYTGNGTAVCNFNVAVNRRWKNKDGSPSEETAWFRVTTWAQQAEIANEYLEKGRLVLVEGRLNPDPKTGGPSVYTTQDGTARASFEVTANIVRFLHGGNVAEASPSATRQHSASVASGNGAGKEEDEIPF